MDQDSGNASDGASPSGSASHDGGARRPGIPGWVRVGGVFLLLTGAVGFLLAGSNNPFVYSKLVHEVMQDPAKFQGRTLRVEGELRQGSIQFREEPCEWRFVIEKEGMELPVRFPQCVVPDTFRDGFGIDVTVQGELEGDKAFLANQVIPRCPSKYEMQQRMQSGEEMPHSESAPLGAAEPPAADVLEGLDAVPPDSVPN